MTVARKRFGQHFLEPAWIDRVLRVAQPQPDDDVIEIGPGRGALTFPLAARVASITAVELDRDLVAWLTPRAPNNVRVVSGDFLTLDPAALFHAAPSTAGYRVVGNLPYNVSSPILFRLIDIYRRTGRVVDATLMLQREVAERLASPAGSRESGVLSNTVQLDADVEIRLTLPPGAFRPPPKVWSAVVRLTFRPPVVDLPDGRRRMFDVLLRSIFAHRRKTLANALKPLASSRGLDSRALVEAAGIDGTRRPESLHLVELVKLADALAGQADPSVV